MNKNDFTRALLEDPLRDSLKGPLGTLITDASMVCSNVLHRILDNTADRGKSALGLSNKNGTYSGAGLPVTTFPFGSSSGKLYPDYVGIACTQGTTLRKVLDNVEQFCRDVETHFDPSVDKTVLVLTDKWDDTLFDREYKQIFLRYAMEDNILFLFVLVTDFGMTPIPFLPWKRSSAEGKAMHTKGEYYEKYQYKELCQDRLFALYPTLSPEVRLLIGRIEEYAPLFSDMLFEPDSLIRKFIAVQEKGTDAEWYNTFVDRPDQLKYFLYSWFLFDVEDLGDNFLGKFSPLEYKLTVAPKCLEDDDIGDKVILHEMIHLHEAVLDVLDTYYHEIILYCLYKDLRDKIPDLDDRIEAHGHMLNETIISNFGGTHDILFLLKSFDLDLKMGYSPGTIFGYGMAR